MVLYETFEVDHLVLELVVLPALLADQELEQVLYSIHQLGFE